MFIIVDERELVTNGYACRFVEEGIVSTGFRAGPFREWVNGAVEAEIAAIEAFLIGECPAREEIPRLIRKRSQAPVIAMNEAPSLEQTLGLFTAGVDDVVRKPVHVREILARVHAIRRRAVLRSECAAVGGIQLSFNGGDPIVNGEALPLPRRERRILEYLVANRGRRLTKTQIVSAVYGLFDEAVDEKRHRESYQQAAQEAAGASGLRSDRFPTLSWLFIVLGSRRERLFRPLSRR